MIPANHATSAARAASWDFFVVTPEPLSFSDQEANADFLTGDLHDVGYMGHGAGGRQAKTKRPARLRAG